MYRRPLVVLGLLAAAAACRADGADRVISRERFIAANVGLRTLPADATAEQRAAVLARYRASGDDLRAWIDAHADDPRVLAEAWQQVAARLDSVAEARPEPLGGAPSEPGDEPVPRVWKDSLGHFPDLPGELDIPRAGRPEPRSRGAVPPPPLPSRERVEIQ